MRHHLIKLLAVAAVTVSMSVVGMPISHAQATAVVRLTDVPGRWFDPAVTVVPVGGTVEFQTTTFGATFTSAIFPCAPASVSDGTCSVDNPVSFAPGFPFDQDDPLVGSVTVAGAR